MATNIVDQTESVLTHCSAMLDTLAKRQMLADNGLREETETNNRLQALFESHAQSGQQLREELSAREKRANREARYRLEALNEERNTLSATTDALSRQVIQIKDALRESRIQRSALESKLSDREMVGDEEVVVESQLRAFEARMEALTRTVASIDSAQQRLKRMLEWKQKHESVEQQKIGRLYESLETKCELNMALKQEVFDTQLRLLRETNAKMERQLCRAQRLAKESELQSEQIDELESLLAEQYEHNEWLLGLIDESNGESKGGRNDEVSCEE